MDNRVFITLRSIQHYDIFRELTMSLEKDVEIGSDIANSIIIPKEESSIEEDYENGLLDKDQYIDLMISKGFIKEVI